jgi:hypothetical protein
MMKKFLFSLLLTLALGMLWAQPAGFEYTSDQQLCAGDISLALGGKIQVNGIVPGSGSWIAAFDETNVLSGSTELNSLGEIPLCQVNTNPAIPVFNSDPDCNLIDSGIDGYPDNPEQFFIVIWNSTDGRYYKFPDDLTTTLFDYTASPPPLDILVDAFKDPNQVWNHTGDGFPNLNDLLNAVLPVELVFFNGRLEGKQVELRWATASEQGSSHFVVQRSADGKTFHPIGQVASAGDSQDLLNYQFTDRSPLEGQNYYRLKQVDLDGTVAYSPIVTVRTGVQDAGGFLLLPNPATDRVELQFAADQVGQEILVTVLDVSGKEVLRQQRQPAAEKQEISVAGLASGVYTVRVQTNGGVFSAKLAISR